MPIFYFKDAVPPGATLHRSLQNGGTAPPAIVMGTGWAIALNQVGSNCLMVGGTEVARTDPGWTATLKPAGPPSPTLGDCWRSEYPLTGTFDLGDWDFVFGLRSVTAAYTGRVRLAVRIWRSSNPSGAGAVELTSGRVVSNTTTANLSLTANAQLNITWTSAVPKTFNNEYLFVNVALEVTAVGNNTSQDAAFFISFATGLITPNLVSSSRTFAAVTG